jgi:hypothetical protein
MVLPRFNWMHRLARVLRALGPYGAIELVVPGGRRAWTASPVTANYGHDQPILRTSHSSHLS